VKQDHIIQKVFVEITVNNKEKAFSIKEDINSFLSVDVFPQIEKYINSLELDSEYKQDGHTLQIPSLELNLDVKSSSLNTELKDKIVQLFKEELSEITKPRETSNQKIENDSKAYWIHNQEKIIQTFIYFLEKGHMPWWNSDKKGISFLEPEIFNAMILTDNFEKKIIPVLSKQYVQDRMINQLSNEQIAQIGLTILKNKELTISLEPDTISHISKLDHKDRFIVWRLVLNVLSEYVRSSKSNLWEYQHLQEYFLTQISRTEATGLLQAKNNRQNLKTVLHIFPFITENEVLESIKNSVIDNPETIKTSVETIYQKNNETVFEDLNQNNEENNKGQYIQNAGLILIHPFIKTFFEHCDLIHPKTQQLTDPELCVHLLHYIATGTTNAPEYDMVFEKFLCNIPLNQSINKHIKLSRKHKTQAKNVIESVQYNWNPMKKSSVALLQNEFFQRSGKLVITDSDYTLTVERKTQDILLDKLAWGISLVKLPWKEKFIFVNW
jgi:hypothetical protein